MSCETFIPCDILKPYIKSFAISETGEERTYKALSHTGLVIGFQYKAKLSLIKNDGQVLLSPVGPGGMHDANRHFKNERNMETLLVFFSRTGASVFFRQPIQELFSENASPDNFMLRSGLLVLEEQLLEAKEDVDRIRILEKFLIARMGHPVPDNLVLTALILIHKSKGNIKITDLVKQLSISQSLLEKCFRQSMGASPKKLASIVRFKHALQSYQPEHSLTTLGYEAGFYDQAHFIREFSSFSGEAPQQLLSRK